MVSIRAKVTLRRRGNLANHINRITKGLEGPTKVKVGFPAGKSPADIVQIAIWNHFGTGGSQAGFVSANGIGGFGGPIPARPFITVAMFKNRGEIRMNLRKIAQKTIQQGIPVSREMPKLGAYGAGLIQGQIASSMGPPNSALTIRIKGSSGTLIHSGRMNQSVTWALVPGASVPSAGSK
jgi:hypothetical protein